MVTNGTYKSGIYNKLLTDKDYEVILPDFSFQDTVIHKMIYDPIFGIKANPSHCTEEVKFLIEKALHFFRSKNTQAIILGCTELSLVFPNSLDDLIVIDSNDSLAKALIQRSFVEAFN